MFWDGTVLDNGSGTAYTCITAGNWNMYIDTNAQVYLVPPPGHDPGNIGPSGATQLTIGQRHTIRAEHDYSTSTTKLHIDNVEVGSKFQTGTAVRPSSGSVRIGQDAPDRYQQRRVYGAMVMVSGVRTHIFTPSASHLNHTHIANVGTHGADWTVNRTASGFKAVLCDRPLLLFGGNQGASYQADDHGPYEYTIIVAARSFGPAVGDEEWFGSGTPSTLVNGALWRKDDASDTLTLHSFSGGAEDSSRAAGISGRQVVICHRASRDGVDAFVDGELVDADISINRAALEPLWKPGESVRISGYEGTSFNAGNFEFIAAALWKRPLTDVEVADAGEELLVGGKNINDHADTINRDAPDSHPITAITYLAELLDGKVETSGDTLTGPMLLAADPVTDLEPTTKRYVDVLTTIAAVDPDPVLDVPSRDGLFWVVINENPVDPINPADMKYTELIGDGVSASVLVVHNLGTTDISVSLWSKIDNTLVSSDIEIIDANSIRVDFSTPPIMDSINVIVTV